MMFSPELLNRLPPAAVWIVLGAFLFFGGISKLSETGLLGSWMKTRSEERKERHENRGMLDAPDYKALHRRIANLEQLVQKQETAAEGDAARIKKLELRIKKLELVEEVHAANQDMTAAFLREDAQWHRDESLRALEENFELSEHRSWTEFCRDYRVKQGLQNGRRWSDDPEQRERRK